MDTTIARELLAKSEALGEGSVVLPSNIKPGTFVQAAADNNYINEETTDGKATTVVLYQAGHFGPMPQTSKSAYHSQIFKLKSLKTQDLGQTMLEFIANEKKTSCYKFCPKMQQQWFTCNEDLSSHILKCQIDLAWALLKLRPTRLFEVELISSPAGKQVPGWSGFNVIIHQPMQIHTTVEYYPMIHGSSTEFRNCLHSNEETTSHDDKSWTKGHCYNISLDHLYQS